ncbi:unnamed protein product [Effrenium voratum]|uniref:Uncharacterized protein n=1 Tax=Effrenium voratum TaxID=2562239 RepID=A0AA36MUV2_9DINO|nr:unnamed protein product [Effrenium voratum]CAJ1450607.1 unnamed protein product [Effrenium voratum]
MPLDSELSKRLEQRRGKADETDGPEGANVEPVRSRAFEARIDGELRSKLQTRSGGQAVKEPERTGDYKAPIDQELAQKLQKRQSQLETAKANDKLEDPGPKPGSNFESHIDKQLAEKLRKRNLVLEAKAAEGDVGDSAVADAEAEAADAGAREWGGDLDWELKEKLRQRRQVINSGDCFEKGQDDKKPSIASRPSPEEAEATEGRAEVPIQAAPKAKTKRRRFWWLFCCSLAITYYGIYQNFLAE